MDAMATGEPASPGGATATSVDSQPSTQETNKGNCDGGVEANHKATVECRPQESTSADAFCSFLAAGDGKRRTGGAARSVVSSKTHVAAGEQKRSGQDTSSGTGHRLRAPAMWYPSEGYFADPDARRNIEPAFGDLHAALRRISRINEDRQTSTNAVTMGKNHDGRKDVYAGRTVDNLPRDFGSLLGFGEIDRLHFLRVMRESEREEETKMTVETSSRPRFGTTLYDCFLHRGKFPQLSFQACIR